MGQVLPSTIDGQKPSQRRIVVAPLGTYPETGKKVVEWRRAEQEFKGAEEEDERHEQNETVASQ